ncbi:ABC transporter substrate-binding protein [Actinacidiphila oryziradicis]|nr:extracellular solute-binding protein [Actinacidiphila oryziradicis]
MLRVREKQGDAVLDPAAPRMPYRIRWATPIAVVALALLANACGSSASTGSASGTSKVPLVVYGAEGYDTTVAKAFQQATGIPTSVYDAHTGIVVSKIEQEKNNPQWGVSWFDGDMAMASFDQQGLLLKGWEPKVSWNSRGLQFVPKDQSYIPTGYTIAATTLYNSAVMPNPPKSWKDLLGPSYRGKLGILNPAIDGPAYPLMAGWAAQFGGVPQMEAYVSALVKNGAKVYAAPDDELNAIKQGTIDVAVAQSSYGMGVGQTQASMKVSYPQSVTPVPSVLGINAKASAAVQAEAKQFVQFVLSPAGQKAMQAGDPHGDSLYWPVLNGVAPRPEVPSPAAIPTKILDAYTWGSQENAINQWFTSTIAR